MWANRAGLWYQAGCRRPRAVSALALSISISLAGSWLRAVSALSIYIDIYADSRLRAVSALSISIAGCGQSALYRYRYTCIAGYGQATLDHTAPFANAAQNANGGLRPREPPAHFMCAGLAQPASPHSEPHPTGRGTTSSLSIERGSASAPPMESSTAECPTPCWARTCLALCNT